MDEKLKEIIKQKQEILKKLDEINNSVTKEDLRNATVAEKAEFMKLTLEIQKKLTIIEAAEELLKEE